jgi:hypothetical protein
MVTFSQRKKSTRCFARLIRQDRDGKTEKPTSPASVGTIWRAGGSSGADADIEIVNEILAHLPSPLRLRKVIDVNVRGSR